MTSSGPRYHSLLEEQVLEQLRPRYEALGYTFVAHPDPSTLPAFMTGYIPDAIASRTGDHIAIEVKGSAALGLSESVGRIRKLFVEQPDWKFTVVYGGEDPGLAIDIPVTRRDALLEEAKAIEQLLDSGFIKPALVMTFALLEATLQTMVVTSERRPRRPDTVIQTLAMNGLIGSAQELQLRQLVALRNRVVHGDMRIDVSRADVQAALDTVLELLTSDDKADGDD